MQALQDWGTAFADIKNTEPFIVHIARLKEKIEAIQTVSKELEQLIAQKKGDAKKKKILINTHKLLKLFHDHLTTIYMILREHGNNTDLQSLVSLAMKLKPYTLLLPKKVRELDGWTFKAVFKHRLACA